jgi:hypothetical protein
MSVFFKIQFKQKYYMKKANDSDWGNRVVAPWPTRPSANQIKILVHNFLPNWTQKQFWPNPNQFAEIIDGLLLTE